MAYQTVGSSMTHLLHVLVQKMGITEYLLKQPTASSRSEWLKERIKINTVVTDCSKYLCLSIHMFFCLEHAHVSVCVCAVVEMKKQFLTMWSFGLRSGTSTFHVELANLLVTFYVVTKYQQCSSQAADKLLLAPKMSQSVHTLNKGNNSQ